MDVLTGGDRGIPDGVLGFPDNLTSFPEPTNISFSIPKGSENEIHPPELINNINSPIQKLIPVRCSRPKVTEFSENPNGGGLELDGPLLINCSSVEVGFLADQLAIPEDSPSLFNANNELAGRGGGSSDPANVFKSVMDGFRAECRNVISRTRALEADLSSSSDEDCESSEANSMSQEKKRISIKKLELFLENMISQVMQKQDQMHKQLMEMVIRREQEMIILEEAWKQQEIERARRDEKERALETCRSLSLISFIQNLMGQHQCETLDSLKPSNLENRGTDIQNQYGLRDDPSSTRWPKGEVQALITVRMALEHKSMVTKAKGFSWEEVAARLAIMGYNRTPEKCKQKWGNINKYYKRMVEIGKKRPRKCPYFNELDVLYKRRLITPGKCE